MASQPGDVQATPGQPILFDLITTPAVAEGPVVLTGAGFGNAGVVYITCPLSYSYEPPPSPSPPPVYEAQNEPAECTVTTWENDRIVLSGLPDHPGSRPDDHLERLLVYRDDNPHHPPDPAPTAVDGNADFGAWIRVTSVDEGNSGYPPYGR